MKSALLKFLTGIATLWPLVTCIFLAADAYRISNEGLDWSGWLGVKQFYPVVFPVLLVLSTFIPMLLSKVKRSESASAYRIWTWFTILLAPLALPAFWYRYIWLEDEEKEHK